MYTEEEVKRLEELGAVEQFKFILGSQFKRNTHRSVDEEVLTIYRNASGEKTYTPNLSCKNCVYDLYHRAAELWKKYKEQITPVVKALVNVVKEVDKNTTTKEKKTKTTSPAKTPGGNKNKKK